MSVRACSLGRKVLNFAVAASCLKHSIFGDFTVTVAEVERLMAVRSPGPFDAK